MATISVIIPVYNTEEYLEACLISVQHQTFDDFEAIIVNDGTTDNSVSIIESFVKNDSRFQVIHQENAGLSEARNSGIQKATAPWITFVDSDDMIAPSFLETLLDAVKETGAEIACCGTGGFTELPAPIPGTKALHTKSWSSMDALTQALYQDRVPDHSAWNKLYSARLWKTTRFPKGKYFEDLCTIPQVFLEANGICSVDSPLYLYRKRDTSILRTAYNVKKAELLDIAEQTRQLASAQPHNKKLMRAANNMVISTSYSILKRTPNTEEFQETRNRAWKHIRELRFKNLFDSKVRIRNKIANLISFLGQETLLKILGRVQ